LNIAISGYLGYIDTSTQGKLQGIWAIVSLVTLNNDVDIESVVDDSKIHTIYYKFLSIFSQSASNQLSTHCSFDHTIEQKDSKEP
jgi:hypothetical protein